MYLGGHPASLSRAAARSVRGRHDLAAGRGAQDLIKDNFIREGLGASSCDDASVSGMVRSLHNRFSHYFTPRENKLFKESTSGEFSGVGMTVVERKRGLQVAGVFKGSPAKRAGIGPGDVITKVNGDVDRGRAKRRCDGQDQGQAGHIRAAHGRPQGRRHPHAARATGRGSRCPVAAGRLGDGRRTRKSGRRPAVVVHLRIPRGAAAGDRAAPEARSGRVRAGPARQRRRAAGRGGAGSSLFVPDGVIVTTDGPDAPAAVFRATGETVDAQAGGGAGGPQHRERVRDRHRGAARAPGRAGGRAAHVRQGSLRPGVRSLQRRVPSTWSSGSYFTPPAARI